MILMFLSGVLKLASGRPANKVAELMALVETLSRKTFQKTESKQIRRSYGKLCRSYEAQILSNSLQNIEILNNTCSTAQNLSRRLCKPAQLELIISQRPDILKQWEYIFAYVLSAWVHPLGSFNTCIAVYQLHPISFRRSLKRI